MFARRLLFATLCALSTASSVYYTSINNPTSAPAVQSRVLGAEDTGAEQSDLRPLQPDVTLGPDLNGIPEGPSGFRSAGYDERNQVLEVEFSNGQAYRWYRVPAATWFGWYASGYQYPYFRHYIYNAGFPWRPVAVPGATTSAARPVSLGSPAPGAPATRLGGNGHVAAQGGGHGGWHAGAGHGGSGLGGGHGDGGMNGGGHASGHGGGHGAGHGGGKR